MFLPVSGSSGRHTSVQLVLCEAAAKNFPLRQIDVSNAFLYADVDAEIYVEYSHTYPTNPPSVCKLKKSLYGIKQAPRLWQQHLNKKLTEVGFRQLPPLPPPRRRLSLLPAVASPSSPPSPLPPPRSCLSLLPRRRLVFLPAVTSPSSPPSPLPTPRRRLWRQVHERNRELVRERGLVRQRGLFSEAPWLSGLWARLTLPLLCFRSRASGAWRFSSCPAPGWRVTSFLPVARPVARDGALPVVRPVARDGALPVVRPVARDGALPVVRPVARDGALNCPSRAPCRPCTTQRLPLEQPPLLLHSVQPPLPHPAPALAAAAPDLPAPTLCSRSVAFSPPTSSSFISLQPWGGGYGGGGSGGDGWCASLPFLLLSFPLLQLPLGGRV
ncbi:unnamed protein product [Closterium sp. NIES-53]